MVAVFVVETGHIRRPVATAAQASPGSNVRRLNTQRPNSRRSNSQRLSVTRWGLTLAVLAVAPAYAADPWADRVVSYHPGTTPVPGFTNPASALGEPTRFTGAKSPYPSVVSPFSPPFEPNEIVSIGEGGWLVVEFNEPIFNDPSHKFGIDFIIFGNGGFIDAAFPEGRVGVPPLLFGLDPDMHVSVSADGKDFIPLGLFTEGFTPTIGYRDSGPFDDLPGAIPTDFTVPTNPLFIPDDFAGITLAEILALYDGSGGGTPIDISASGLESIRYVRIDVRDDGDPKTARNVEIDGFAATPEPATLSLLLLGLAALRRSRNAHR
jgi:hypothetical protein